MAIIVSTLRYGWEIGFTKCLKNLRWRFEVIKKDNQSAGEAIPSKKINKNLFFVIVLQIDDTQLTLMRVVVHTSLAIKYKNSRIWKYNGVYWQRYLSIKI